MRGRFSCTVWGMENGATTQSPVKLLRPETVVYLNPGKSSRCAAPAACRAPRHRLTRSSPDRKPPLSPRQCDALSKNILIMHDPVQRERIGVAGIGPDGMRFLRAVDHQAAVVTVEASLVAIGRRKLRRKHCEREWCLRISAPGENVVRALPLHSGLSGSEAANRRGVLIGNPAAAEIAHTNTISRRGRRNRVRRKVMIDP